MALGRQRIVRFDEEMGMPPPPIQQKQAALPAIKLGVASSGKNKIFDPSSDFILTWNRVFLFSCFLALFIDPLYFYIPKIVYGTAYSCAGTDRHLTIILAFFRSITDLFYVIHIIIKFRTAFIKTSSTWGIFKGGDLVTDPKEIAWKYLRSDFAIDVVAALPLPQIIVWYVIPAIKYSIAEHNNNIMVLIVLAQYLPRLYLIFPLTYEIIEATKVVAKTAWQGAVYNLLLYMIASHVRCYGQTLSVSTYVGETLFCIFLAVFGLVLESSGLVLFAYVIGNVQYYC
uniref:Uncharacterized protein n=1 Tax=Aegilops tauschii TaxID=37682 RepID=M8AI10_AEGTA